MRWSTMASLDSLPGMSPLAHSSSLRSWRLSRRSAARTSASVADTPTCDIGQEMSFCMFAREGLGPRVYVYMAAIERYPGA
jgi:hypothetical protein